MFRVHTTHRHFWVDRKVCGVVSQHQGGSVQEDGPVTIQHWHELGVLGNVPVCHVHLFATFWNKRQNEIKSNLDTISLCLKYTIDIGHSSFDHSSVSVSESQYDTCTKMTDENMLMLNMLK